jgi:hypothetical protein
VALKTFFVCSLADFKCGRGLFHVRKIVFLTLEIFPVFFVVEHGRLIGDRPIIADRQGMALVTPSRWGNCFPGGKHGAAGTESESRSAGNNNEFFHELSPEARWQRCNVAELC